MACPSQWEGYLKNNKPFYIRYRWGYLSIRMGKKDKDVYSAIRGREIYGEQIDEEGWDGIIRQDTVIAKLMDIESETNLVAFIRDISFKFQCGNIYRWFWLNFLGGRKIIKQKTKELTKHLKETKL